MQIASRDYWFKVVEMLQQNWALIEPAERGVTVFFLQDASGVCSINWRLRRSRKRRWLCSATGLGASPMMQRLRGSSLHRNRRSPQSNTRMAGSTRQAGSGGEPPGWYAMGQLTGCCCRRGCDAQLSSRVVIYEI